MKNEDKDRGSSDNVVYFAIDAGFLGIQRGTVIVQNVTKKSI